MYKKLIKYCSIFYKLKSILPIQGLKQVYFAFVHSRLLYAVEIYANTYKCYLDKLIKLNNKHKNYSTLPVPLLHQQNLILFAHKILRYSHKLPVLFKYYLNQNDDIHTYNTRLKNSIHLYRTNTDYEKRSSKYRAAKYYNDLPKEIKFKLDESGRYNKSVLKNYLLNSKH